MNDEGSQMHMHTEYALRSSTTATTLADALVEKAMLRGKDVAFRIVDVTSEGGGLSEAAVVTYGALHRRASAVARRLLQVAKPGDRALLLYEPGRDYIGSFFGCLYAGIIAVPSYPPNAP